MSPIVEYGPFLSGYVSSVDGTRIGRQAIGPGSTDVAIDQRTGIVFRRRGSATVFDTYGSNVGLLEAKWSSKFRQMFALNSPSLSDGYRTLAALVTNDSLREGTLYFRSTNSGGSNQQPCLSYGNLDYTSVYMSYHRANVPTYFSTHFGGVYAGAKAWDIIMSPLWTEHATIRFTRCNDNHRRRLLFPGSRRVLQASGKVVAPNRWGTPAQWDTGFNDAVGSGYNKERIRPLGPMGSAFPVRYSSTQGGAVGNPGPIDGKSGALYSVVPRYADGSYGAPYIPNPVLDLVAVDPAHPTTGATYPNGVLSVTLKVPVMHGDVVARIVCRTQWVDLSTTPQPALSPYLLYVVGSIENNTAMDFVDRATNAGITDDPTIIRYDRVMAPRARTAWTMDGRVVFGGELAPSPCAIQLNPWRVKTASGPPEVFTYFDSYDEANASAYLDAAFFQLYGDHTNGYSAKTLKLFSFDRTLNAGNGGYGTPVSFDLTTSGMTLQNLVDKINNEASTEYGPLPADGKTVQWHACLAPGVEGSEPVSWLQATNNDLDSLSWPGADDVFGDDAVFFVNDSNGHCMVPSGQGVPNFLYFTPTCQRMTQSIESTGLQFTVSSPANTAQSQDAPYSANGWVGTYETIRKLTDDLGILLGGETLLNGSLVIYSKGIATLRNIRGGKSGVDADYRLEPWLGLHGGICGTAICAVNGVVFYMTRTGLMANDGVSEVCISDAVWAASGLDGGGRGDWMYEMTQCLAALELGLDQGRFYLNALNGKLYVGYRSSNSAGDYPDRVMVYDYSLGVKRQGVQQVLRDSNGTPYGWSAPYKLRASVMGEVLKSDGPHVYGAIEQDYTSFSTGDGRVDELEVGTQDNGGAIRDRSYLQVETFGTSRQKKRIKRITHTGWNDVGAYNLFGTRNESSSGGDTVQMGLLQATDGQTRQQTRMRGPQVLRSPLDTLTLQQYNSPGTGTRSELHAVEVEYELLQTPQ